MDLYVTSSATGVLRVLVMLRPGGLDGTHTMIDAVAGQAEVVDARGPQKSWIGRAMGSVTNHTAVGLDRRMRKHERPLLICVTLDTRGIYASSQPGLFQFKPAVRVMAVTAFHRALEHFVMEGSGELMFDFAVTTGAKLRLAVFQQFDG